MRPRTGQASPLRRARWEDLDAILDLLTQYGLPRAYFEPFYRDDPTYRPEQSWLVEQDGGVAAHLRVYDRWIRLGASAIRVAGVGNVITARASRGRGYAGQLLRAALAASRAEGYAYSLLWTHLPGLYARHGWAPIEQGTVQAVLSRVGSGRGGIRQFRLEDLPAVMRLYERVNADRAGPTVRTPEYWRGQLAWLAEDPDGFLVARTTAGELAGYVRSRARQTAVEVLELGLPRSQLELGRSLLARVAAGRRGELRAQLPPSLVDVFRPEERDVVGEPGLMGRVVEPGALGRALEPVWGQRLAAAGLKGAPVRLAVSGGAIALRLGDGTHPARPLDEGGLGHLLFHGFDDAAGELLGSRADSEVLQALFPPQDFVIWPADAF